MTTRNKAALRALADKLSTLPQVQTGDEDHLRNNEPETFHPDDGEDSDRETNAALKTLEKTLEQNETGPARLNMDMNLNGDIGGMPAFALATAGWPAAAAENPNDQDQTLASRAQALLGLDDRGAAALFDGPNYAGRQRRFIEPQQAALACRLAADGASPESFWPTVDRKTIHNLSNNESRRMYHSDTIYEAAADRQARDPGEPGENPHEHEGPDQNDLEEIKGYEWSTMTTVAIDAQIHPTAEIGRTVTVANHCWIAAGARVQNGVRLSPNVKIAENTEVTAGNERCSTELDAGVTIGADCQINGCKLGSHATIGSGVIIEPGAVIGDHVVIGDGATILKDTRIPAYANVPPVSEITPGTLIKPDDRPYVQETAEVHENSKLGPRTHVHGASKIEAYVATGKQVDIQDSTVLGNTEIGARANLERSSVGPWAQLRSGTRITDSEIGEGVIDAEAKIERSKIDDGYHVGRSCSVTDSGIGADLKTNGPTTIRNSSIGERCRTHGRERETTVVKSMIGDDVTIGNATIERSTLEDGTTINPPSGGVLPRESTITDSRVGADTTAGTHGLVMKGSTTGQNCVIEGTITDSTLGRAVRTGPGSVVHRAKIGHGSTVGERSIVDHGTTVGKDVVIEDGVRIGAKVRISDDVVIGRNAQIADGTKVPPKTRIPAGGTFPGRADSDRNSSPNAASQLTEGRSGAGVAVRGAGRPAGDAKPRTQTRADRTPSSGRTH